MMVLFPAPFGPSNPKISPLLMTKETDLTASILSNVLVRSRICISTEDSPFDKLIASALMAREVDGSTSFSPLLYLPTIDIQREIGSFLKLMLLSHYKVSIRKR